MAVLDKIDMDRMSYVWGNDIIMYVMWDLPSIGVVIRYIAKEWPQVSKPQVFLHDEGYFVIRFGSRKDKAGLSCNGRTSHFLLEANDC